LPFALIRESPLVPGLSPVSIHYRDRGTGEPLVFLHGGWGYEIYPFDRQAEVLGEGRRVLIPDRSGYGRSPRVARLPVDFHRRAAAEMESLLDTLGIGRPALWGHSDGAVIAAWMGLARPERYRALVLEALHYFRNKPGSREFFETMSRRPELLGERVCRKLALEHGEDHWRTMTELGGRAWLALADEAPAPGADLYDGRLGQLALPVLVVHGAADPRTEPGELEAVRSALPNATFAVLEGGGHSPHSESAASAACSRAVAQFLQRIDSRGEDR